MNHSTSYLAARTRTAKLMIAALPAATILLVAAIALATQPSAATERKLSDAPDRYPAVNWPALGAGDYAPAATAMPSVTWPALGAGDFDSDQPARLPKINWPALGAGDFETAK